MKNISFYVNGTFQTIKDEYPLYTSLGHYIRNVLKLTGTKVYCHEGGCGCCVVHASVFDQSSGETKEFSVNSCLFPLYSCDGYSFTTVEGLGNKNFGLHPLQKRLADANGSQCGFCSPGFVMTMYSKLKNNAKPSKEEIENSFDGNICRCTGYRAILDAMKSFAHDEHPIDIEDLKNLKCLNKEKNKCNGCTDELESFHIQKDGKNWYSPVCVSQLKNFFSSNSRVRFMNGNTSIGVYKRQGPFDCFIDLKNVKELNQVSVINDSLTIGSAITLTRLQQIFKETSTNEKFSHLSKMADCLNKIGNVHIRNVASWAGNLAIKKEHKDFPSDVLIIFEICGARLNIYNKNNHIQLSLSEFLDSNELESNQYLIESVLFPSLDQNTKINYAKVSPRSTNSHAYINFGYRFTFESPGSTVLKSKPFLVFNGLTENFFHALETEKFLNSKDISNNEIFKKSVEILTKELDSCGINEISDPLSPPSDYKINLAVSLFYKSIMELNKVGKNLEKTIDNIIDIRTVSKSEQSFESKTSLHPITKPMAKINAYSQTSGETKYVDDLSLLSNQTHGALILSTLANAKIESIQIDKVLNLPGVIAVYLAKDIPGENNLMPKPFNVEPVFADKEVSYCGQPLGIVIAESHEIAKKAARMVQVNYVEIKKPILTIEDAIEENSFHPKPIHDLVIGDAQSAIEKSTNKISGELSINSSQFNFYLEGIICNVEPTEDGYKIEVTTQWIDSVQRSVAMVLGIPASTIDVQVKQIGGGFGGKTTRANIVATAAALGAHFLRRPVKIHLDLNDCMDIIGKRPIWYVKYSVGFEDDGKLNGMDYDWYSTPGFSPNGSLAFCLYNFFDSAYSCPNYSVRQHLAKTNKAASTEVRSPDVFTCYTVTENVIQHVANHLGKDPIEIRERNFFKKGDKTASGHSLPYIEIDKLVTELKQTSEYYKRKEEIELFNSENKHKKKGIALIPMRYPLTYNLGYYNALVAIRHHDGSVLVSHGGIEMGQGIHTKVAQCVAFEFGIPIEIISVKSTNNLVNPNVLWSGGSVTSELCCKSVMGACSILKERLEPIRKQMSGDYTWAQLIEKAFSLNADLSAMYLQRAGEFEDIMTYDIDAAACTEALIDTLTGETQILRTDILYDCGQTINGLIDVGQAEGGFMMGLGYMMLETAIFDPQTGKCINNGTWEYKPPMAKDVPVDFRIKFVENKPNPLGVLGSKATGEPPLILSNSVLFAIRAAIEASRKEKGVHGHFKLDLPATIDKVQQACLVDTKDFSLN